MPNNDVGQIERKTQNRIIKLFCEQLGYTYLGNWEDRLANSNIEESERESICPVAGIVMF